MSDPATLFDWPTLRPLVRVETTTRVVRDGLDDVSTIQEQFLRFHSANPWVYDVLVALARDLVNHGARKIGIGMLFEVVRWQYARSTIEGAEEFKLNNNYRSRYARMIMERERDLDGRFETRQLATS